jgi:hypothetical protein
MLKSQYHEQRCTRWTTGKANVQMGRGGGCNFIIHNRILQFMYVYMDDEMGVTNSVTIRMSEMLTKF